MRNRGRATQQILANLDQTMAVVTCALKDLKDPARRTIAVRNLVVFGRAVTNVLQNLRSTEPGFDAWYAPIEQSLRSDPLAKFFYELRTGILKRGEAGLSSYARMDYFGPETMRRLPPPPVPNAAFFIGDQEGGSGWIVEVSPTVREKYYIDVPGVITGVSFRDAPGSTSAGDSDAVKLCGRYAETLRAIVAQAHTRFGEA